MKLGNLTTPLKPRTKTILVGETPEGEKVYLTLHAPRLGTVERISKELPEPVAPMGREVERDSRGNPLKDAQGRVKVMRDTDDPAYKAAKDRRDAAETMAMILEASKGQIVPDCTPDQFSSRVDYYMAVRDELEAMNIDLATIGAMGRAVMSLCVPTVTEVESAEAALGEGN